MGMGYSPWPTGSHAEDFLHFCCLYRLDPATATYADIERGHENARAKDRQEHIRRLWAMNRSERKAYLEEKRMTREVSRLIAEACAMPSPLLAEMKGEA